MTISNIKKLLAGEGKVVFVDDDEVVGVFLSFAEYKKITEKCQDNCVCDDNDMTDDDEHFTEINFEDEEEETAPPLSSVVMEPKVQMPNVDDLPF